MPSSFHAQPPVALTVAGSDCSAGAGIQADLKTFSAHGAYGLTAVTCVVAEVPGRVAAIQPVEPGIVREQIELCLGAFPVAAMKTGMLYSREIIEALADLYESLHERDRPRLVVDPVMVASSGDALLRTGALAAYQERLFPLAALVTPNLDEASVLLDGRRIADADGMRAAGQELCTRYGTAFLIKGGHLGGDTALDVLCRPGGSPEDFTAPFTRGVSTHGTGCTYSAAITANLALGFHGGEEITRAKAYITRAVADGFRWHVDARRTEALRHWHDPADAVCRPGNPPPSCPP